LLRIGFNTVTVWSVLCECNEHNTLQTVLKHTYFTTYICRLQQTVPVGCGLRSPRSWCCLLHI